MGHEARHDTLYATCFLVYQSKKVRCSVAKAMQDEAAVGEAETCQTLDAIGRGPGFTHRFPGDHAQPMALQGSVAAKDRREPRD
jgi:hypothetical protein